jgi:hypothetical protein
VDLPSCGCVGLKKAVSAKAVAVAAAALSSSPVTFACYLFHKNTCIRSLLARTAGYAGVYLAYHVDPPLLARQVVATSWLAGGEQGSGVGHPDSKCRWRGRGLYNKLAGLGLGEGGIVAAVVVVGWRGDGVGVACRGSGGGRRWQQAVAVE